MHEDLLRHWTTAVTGQASEGNETMGLLWGDKIATRVKVEGLIIPLHERQTRTEYVVGELELEEAIKWGRDMGGWWLGWVHTHPNHRLLLLVQDVCTTNTLGIHLRSILLEGRATIAMVRSWVSRGGYGVVNALKAYKLTSEGHKVASRCATRAPRARQGGPP